MSLVFVPHCIKENHSGVAVKVVQADSIQDVLQKGSGVFSAPYSKHQGKWRVVAKERVEDLWLENDQEVGVKGSSDYIDILRFWLKAGQPG